MGKCDECVHNRHHRPGSVHAVMEGHDDPYEYWYCAKGHWDSEVEYTEDEWPDPEDCKDVCYPKED